MKTLLFYTIILLSSIGAQAGVERVSFYFEDTTMTLTNSSMEQLRLFKSRYMNERAFYVQVIEINSYAKTNNNKESFDLSEKRMIQVCKLLHFCEEQPAMNPWGDFEREVNFIPTSWNRVDVYYFVSDLYEPTIISYQNNNDNAKASSDRAESQLDKQLFQSNETTEQKNDLLGSFALNIEFIPGKAKIKQNYKPELHKLLKVLQDNEELQAHIGGHVCCGNRKSLSKRRARAVHRFLVKNGIDRHRLTYEGYGNEVPLAFPERTAKDRSTNRRVDIDLTANQLVAGTTN